MSETQRAIAEASISLFLERGYVATSISDIRKASGATTGSIYHFFGSKAGIAVYIWEDAIAGWQQRFQDTVAFLSAETQIKASVRSFLEWAHRNRRQFSVYDELLTLSRSLGEFAPIAQKIEKGHEQASALYLAWANAEEVRDLPWPLARALIMGPSLEFLRAGHTIDEMAIAELVQAAWCAVCPPSAAKDFEP
jgi:AcrR family transcriptional regulator